MSENNLDKLCARYGYRIAADVYGVIKKAAENHITKSLGVLQEDGVYAFALYQVSRGKREKEGAEKLKELAEGLLREVPVPPFNGKPAPDLLEGVRGNPQKELRGLAEDLDSLLLAKRLLEQTLIYARYHAKALEELGK